MGVDQSDSDVWKLGTGTVVTTTPGSAWVAMLALVIVPASAVMIPASGFAVKFLQETHGWRPAQIPLLMVGGGFLVFASMALSGTVADRIGRRRMLMGALVLATSVATQLLPTTGLLMLLPVGWVGLYLFLYKKGVGRKGLRFELLVDGVLYIAGLAALLALFLQP